MGRDKTLLDNCTVATCASAPSADVSGVTRRRGYRPLRLCVNGAERHLMLAFEDLLGSGTLWCSDRGRLPPPYRLLVHMWG